MVEAEDDDGLSGLQSLPHHQGIHLGGELPVYRAQGVSRPVGPQVVVLTGTAAGPGTQNRVFLRPQQGRYRLWGQLQREHCQLSRRR